MDGLGGEVAAAAGVVGQPGRPTSALLPCCRSPAAAAGAVVVRVCRGQRISRWGRWPATSGQQGVVGADPGEFDEAVGSALGGVALVVGSGGDQEGG